MVLLLFIDQSADSNLIIFQRAEKIDNCKTWIERHRDHMSKLEALMRAVVNDAIDAEQVSGAVI